MISKPLKFMALFALPFVLASCTTGDTENKPDEQTFSANTMKLESLPVFQKTNNIPEGWKTLSGEADSPSLETKNGKCSINVETRTVSYTGMGLGDDSITRSTFLTNYGFGIDTKTAIRSTIDIPKFAGKTMKFETYDFQGERSFPEGEGKEIKTKDSHSFVAMRGFDQPLDIDSGEKVAPIVVIDYHCTDADSFDLTTAKSIIESMEFGYVDTEAEANEESSEEQTTGEENE